MAEFRTPFPWIFFTATNERDDIYLSNWFGFAYGLGGHDNFYIGDGFTGYAIGGTGWDRISFENVSQGIRFDNTLGYLRASTGVLAVAEAYDGTDYGDVFVGGDVDTYLDHPNSRNNDFNGGAGNDIFYNGDGTGRFIGGSGDDIAYGGADTMSFSGGSGEDRAYGGSGDENLRGNSGNDTLFGGDGNDSLDGGSSNDFLRGGDDEDHVRGGTGRDYVFGGDDDDVVEGGHWEYYNLTRPSPGDDDFVYGGAGNDDVYGGIGNDVVHGGRGVDDLYGDNTNRDDDVPDGADTFMFEGAVPGGIADTGTLMGLLTGSGPAPDTIWDFDALDRIRIPYGMTYAGDTQTPDAREFSIFDYGSGWIVRWNNGGDLRDVIVYGDDPTGQVFADIVPLI